MKIILATVVLTATFLAAGVASTPAHEAGQPPILSIDELYKLPEKPIDAVVVIEGFPTKVCQKGGVKAWIRDCDPEINRIIRVDKTPEMKPFATDSVGQTLRITGVLREQRMDAAYFDEWEARVRSEGDTEEEPGGSCGGNCSGGKNESAQQKMLQRIAGFRQQLERSSTGYLASLWLDGLRWEVVETAPQS
jgi:hypothetical protein